MKILLIEPFFSGSHQQWANSYQQSSQHDVDILSLPGRHWKWRMYGAAVSLAKMYLEGNFKADLILASDMLDLATFVALTRKTLGTIPIALYFHENQITYPWSPTDEDIKLQRNNQYGFINYTSALVADYVFYNSQYHLNSFTNSLTPFLKQFPDYRELQQVALIQKKSKVLHLGMDLSRFDAYQVQSNNEKPLILWNHRWEYDKNPQGFYEALCSLKEKDLDFNLVMLGEQYQKSPKVFELIKEEFATNLLHYGYVENFEDYAYWLWKSDILAVSNYQDFFGGSIVEAIYCHCTPLLPDRLAYPEHIPAAFQDEYIYKDKNDFHGKLQQTILHFEENIDNTSLADYVARYDWSILAAHYDRTFEKIILE